MNAEAGVTTAEGPPAPLLPPNRESHIGGDNRRYGRQPRHEETKSETERKTMSSPGAVGGGGGIPARKAPREGEEAVSDGGEGVPLQ